MKELRDIDGIDHDFERREHSAFELDLAERINALNTAVRELQDEVDLLKNRLHKPLDMDRMIETATAAAKTFEEEPTKYTIAELRENFSEYALEEFENGDGDTTYLDAVLEAFLNWLDREGEK